MNIVDEIRIDIEKNLDFCSPYLKREYKQRLRHSLLQFLGSRKYRELEDFSRSPRTTSYNIHGKSEKLIPLGDLMNNFELYKKYAYENQRLHYPHLLNVYLLGLYIFNNSPIIRCVMLKKISQEPNRIYIPKLSKYFDFSSGSPLGEFYYRWRFAALCHDFGYPFELSSKNIEMQRVVFDDIRAETSIGVCSIEDLFHYEEKDLLAQLDEKIKKMDLKKYIELRESEPQNENSVYDHGIYGALLFLHSMHSHFKRYPLYHARDDGTTIVTSEELLENSLLSVSVSIAKHNLDSDDRAFQSSLIGRDSCIFDLRNDPLSYLLKLCDEIQEWYKFEKNRKLNDQLYNEELKKPKMHILFESNKIIIYDIEKREKIENKINKLLNPSDIIVFE